MSVLAKHVLDRRGPGLLKEHKEDAMNFWSNESIRNHSDIPSRILIPDDIPEEHALDEKIALRWNPGSTVDFN